MVNGPLKEPVRQNKFLNTADESWSLLPCRGDTATLKKFSFFKEYKDKIYLFMSNLYPFLSINKP